MTAEAAASPTGSDLFEDLLRAVRAGLAPHALAGLEHLLRQLGEGQSADRPGDPHLAAIRAHETLKQVVLSIEGEEGRALQQLCGLTPETAGLYVGRERRTEAAGQTLQRDPSKGPLGRRQVERIEQRRLIPRLQAAVLATLPPGEVQGRSIPPLRQLDIFDIAIREAVASDFEFICDLIDEALAPFYGGDHRAHARRIFEAHIAGGVDRIGHFSVEQKMFVAVCDGSPVGVVHLVGKRQQTYKISPLIVAPSHRGVHGVGTRLLEYAELYARSKRARQIYCTAAEQNHPALRFFLHNDYIVAGRSESHYKIGTREVMLYKLLTWSEMGADRPQISVVPCANAHKEQVRQLLLKALPAHFTGINDGWVDALFAGYDRRLTGDVNAKYKLLFVAVDRHDRVLGVVGATPKKGEPIKLMPFVATNHPSFLALLTDLPYQLKPYGRKVYTHLAHTPPQAIALQRHGWTIDAALPAAYHEDLVTYQWSMDISSDILMRTMRVKDNYLDFIRQGRKTLEVRVAYDSIKTIRPGDRIRLSSHSHTQIVSVRDVRKYGGFETMLRHEDPDKIVPGKSRSETLHLLRSIYGPDRELLGIVVLEIENEAEAGVQPEVASAH